MKVTIIAHTNSKQPNIEKDENGVLHLYVSERPVDGDANVAIQASLAEYYGIPKSFISLVKGTKSKRKVFEVEGN